MRASGSSHYKWAGGVTIDTRGYVLAVAKGHPKARRGRGEYVYQHILVAERALGRYLPSRAVVHHVDSDKSNNANTNLVICEDNGYHHALHARQRVLDAGGCPDTQKICGQCHRMLLVDDFYKKATLPSGLQIYCKDCTKKNNKHYHIQRRSRRLS